MTDDVPGLLRGQPVVQRDGHAADLAGRAHDGDDLQRVRAAPDDLLARPGTERQQRVGDPVRLRLKLGIRPLDDAVAAPVVDDGKLVRLSLGVDRQDVWHRTCPSLPVSLVARAAAAAWLLRYTLYRITL